MIFPPDEQVKAGIVARDAIALGRKLCGQSDSLDAAKLDAEIESFIRDNGCTPALKGYKPPFSERTYEHSICLSLNQEAVHGVPEGKTINCLDDIITLDLVVRCNDWHVDTARTFTRTTKAKEALFVLTAEVICLGAQKAILPNKPMAMYGISVEKAAETLGMSVIKEYCGHGIGRGIHELPQVVNYCNDYQHIFQVGRSYAVEPVLAQTKTYELNHEHEDGWTVRANTLVAHNEDTVFISSNGIVNLTGDKNERE